MNKEVWMLRGGQVSGPYLFKNKGGGWVRFHDHNWCARPDEIFNTKKEVFKELLRRTEMKIEWLEKKREKLQSAIKHDFKDA